MQKGRAFVFVGLIAGLLGLAHVACDDESSSKFDEDKTDGGGGSGDSGPGLIPDGSTADANQPVDCKPQNGAAGAAWKAPTKSTACTAQQLADYYDACLIADPDAGAGCKAWTDANAACAQCIEPDDNSGPVQWHRDRYYYTLNVAGCLALERSEPNAGQCPATYHDSIACQRASCDGCFSAPNATFQDFQACQKTAKDSACSTQENAFKTTCGANFNAPDGGAFDCFRKSDDDAKKHFVRVEGIFCGP